MAKSVKRGHEKMAVAYIRRSTSRQDLSPAAQADAMTQWANAHGVTIFATYLDTVSGSTPTEIRPGWTAALDAARAQGAGLFLVAKRDRIGRDSLHVALAGRAVAMAGATLTSADGSGNGDTAADALMRTVLDAVSQYELSCIRTRTREALAAKRRQGAWCPPVAPYGYARSDGALWSPMRPSNASWRRLGGTSPQA